ncbi:hypothetical protein WJX72_010752 [[Myrmecia] bisecta]|uniref:Acyl-protein thioesterase 1 n=1 Tax=[Myrmecia] bisecta TaxID=41462 RepID=A0AAW1PP88_9CHLO
MPGWFDLRGIEFGRVDPSRFDHQGIQESVDYVGSLIQQEVEAGIPANRIVVGGFSQGGHIAFKTLLAARRALAGCIALSTWLEPTFQAQVADEVKRVPVFIGHGSADPLVPAFLASTSQSTLQARGFSNVSMHVYPGLAHSSCAQEIDEARDFLLKVIPDKPPPTAAEVEQMSVKQLKEFLRSRHINTSTMLEKTELVARAKAECGSN